MIFNKIKIIPINGDKPIDICDGKKFNKLENDKLYFVRNFNINFSNDLVLGINTCYIVNLGDNLSTMYGGIEFFSFEELNYDLDIFAVISIPSDAKIYIFNNHKYIANKINVKMIMYKNKNHVTKLNHCEIIDLQKSIILLNPVFLRYIYYQSNIICEFAVNHDGMTIQYMNNPTYKLCILALKQNGLALQYVSFQNDELCKVAVSQNGLALQYVKHQSLEICTLAVTQNGLALQYVDKDIKTKKISAIAVYRDITAFSYC